MTIADDMVILDVVRDAYFCLAGEARALTNAADVGPAVNEARVAELLREAGLIGDPSSTLEPSLAPPPRPGASAVPIITAGPAWRDIPQASRGVLDVLTGYRGRSFSQLIRSVSTPEAARCAGPPSAELLALVDRFHRWAPFAPLSGKCLLRSYMLLRLLRRAGHDADWVFGVSTWPFRAHCWLQCGDVALDDSIEYLAAFQPIMAV